MQKGSQWAMFVGGLGLGTGLMYLMDPERGRRRRAYLRDQAVHAVNVLGDMMDTTARDLANRARGLVAETRAMLRREAVPDEILEQRVRAEMGRAVSHPHAIEVQARDGHVILSGPVLASEVDGLLSTVARVRGVKSVENRLEVHERPDSISSLQGGSTRPGRYGLARENWPPAVRFLVGTTGGALAAYGLSRRNATGAALGAVGLALFARAATNLPFDRLTGIGAGRWAIDFQKAININAPVEEVFRFCSHYSNFPKFMSHVREVTGNEQGQTHWVVDGPGGIPVSWDAVITEFVPNERIAWKSVEGSMIQQAGIMRFDRNPDGSTRLEVRMQYNPPAGAIGHGLATLFGANPKREMDEDFNRLKSLIETGKTTAHHHEVTREELAV